MHNTTEVDDRQGTLLYHATPVYAELATSDDAVYPGNKLDLTTPLFAVGERYHHLPEARNLTWTDTFFEDDDDIVAVFDLDYDAMESFYTSLGWVGIGLSLLLYPPLWALAALTMTPCYLRTNVQWAVRSKHVAITRDGIKFVTDRRSCGWGLACMDIGKNSKTGKSSDSLSLTFVDPWLPCPLRDLNSGAVCLCLFLIALLVAQFHSI
jgi:hypothetical protein